MARPPPSQLHHPSHTHIHTLSPPSPTRQCCPLPYPSPPSRGWACPYGGPGQTSGPWNKQAANVGRQDRQLEPAHAVCECARMEGHRTKHVWIPGNASISSWQRRWPLTVPAHSLCIVCAAPARHVRRTDTITQFQLCMHTQIFQEGQKPTSGVAKYFLTRPHIEKLAANLWPRYEQFIMAVFIRASYNERNRRRRLNSSLRSGYWHNV